MHDNLNVVVVCAMGMRVLGITDNFIHKTVDNHGEVYKIVCTFQIDFITAHNHMAISQSIVKLH